MTDENTTQESWDVDALSPRWQYTVEGPGPVLEITSEWYAPRLTEEERELLRQQFLYQLMLEHLRRMQQQPQDHIHPPCAADF